MTSNIYFVLSVRDGEVSSPCPITLLANKDCYDGASATPEVEHEENWVQLSFLAYVQLWAARKLASRLPRRWERYLPQKTEGFLSPSLVQRDLNRIITEMGTPANSPKRRGFSGGRTTGMIQTPRTRHEVIKKAKKLEPSPPIAL